MDLSIIMPVFNEKATIIQAVRRALDAELPVEKVEVIVVDDGSTDGTLELLRAEPWPERVRIIELGTNSGKGSAVRAGADEARGTFLAVLDADLEYHPDDFADLLTPLIDGELDAAVGTRVWQAHSAFSYWYVTGNRLINTAANILYNAYLSDFGCCLKVIRTDLFRSLDLREPGFGFDAELVARLLRRRSRIYEVPVRYRARGREEGKKITTRDGMRILVVFVRCRLR
jgi:glycosyltransferase involved in cell wall biosynthesis